MTSFDTPLSSTIKRVYVSGTLPANNDVGYVEVQAVVSRGNAKETFYKTFQIAASPTRVIPSLWAGSGLCSIVITPKLSSTQSVTSTLVLIDFKH
ncbi:hypothetical protein CDLVIII_3614 [Clostridium sp. DL-VIII]|uniref:hypothetical protein n=1 Tax=Clostridium sp. DL-VIII TaxID=641107 RepID=UPI00023AFC6D|nr:hypothetical protein [Clostridium sp. DL-VIII]EHJ00172.1 hypothetical protein CDLVIII_3614 [Clostridium sp. DL-VIII]